jgi:serine phosphatase RsbU (regulator of sigma subunit)
MATCVYLRLPPPPADGDGDRQVVVGLGNAGHCPPLVVSLDGGVRLLEGAACPPLGAVPGLRYTQQEHDVDPGATVVLYTDGLVERKGEPLEEGLDRLEAAAAEAARGGPVGPDELCDLLLTRMLDGAPEDDDVALLAVRIGGAVVAGPPAGRAPEARAGSGQVPRGT